MLAVERTVFPVSSRVRHTDRGLGVVEAAEGRNIRVRFDGEAGTMLYNPSTAPIERLVWREGDQVLIHAMNVVGVVARLRLDGDLALYSVQVPGEDRPFSVPEAGLSDAPDLEYPDELLAAGRFDQPKQFYFRTIGHYLACARRQIGTLGVAARIEPKPHQAFVAQRVVNAPRPRFLLADEVGLGKTIETGLILQELRARGGLDRVLIVVPPNLATQWLYELSSKFNEPFKLFNSKLRLDQERAAHPLGNPWEIGRNIITTQSYITAHEAEWSDIASVPWDMVVFDEAHHVRRQRDSGDRMTTSTLYRFASQISQQTRGLLLLTATPMQLDPFELYSLAELLDPALFFSYEFFQEQREQNRALNGVIKRVTEFADLGQEERQATLEAVEEIAAGAIDAATIAGVATRQRSRDLVVDALAEKHLLSEIMIRNRKRLIGGFTSRIPHVIPVTLTEAEHRLYLDLGEFVRAAYRSVPDRQRFTVGFMLVGYQKRLTSSLHSFCLSLERRIGKLERGEVRGGSIPLSADELSSHDLDRVMNTFTDSLALGSRAGETISEAEILGTLLAQARALPRDTKYEALDEALEKLFARDAGERVVIFTQFLDTLAYLEAQLAQRWPVAVFHGGLKPSEKDAAIGAFQTGGARILLTTEAGGEGRNLQIASVLVNYDLPWNPMKVEQRIGRLDRIGQTRDVRIFNFAIAGTVEERVLDVLDRRIHAFEETVGGLDPILGTMETDIQKILLESDPGRIDADLTAYADAIDVASAQARAADDVLRDFALDRRSFDSRMREAFDAAEQDRVLRHANKLGKSMLKQIGAEFAPLGDDIFRVRLGKRLAIELPAKIRDVYQITFNQRQAVQEDLVEFGTFGHPLFDALLTYATGEDFGGGLTAIRTLASAEHGGFRGFQFNIMVTVSSLRETQRLLVVPVGLDGVIRLDLADLLLDAFDWRNTPSPFDPAEFADWGERVEQARTAAEGWVEDLLARELAEMRARRQEEHEAERRKIERFCSYREQEGRRKIEHVEQIVARLRESDRDEDRRVIPIWERTMQNNRDSLHHVEQDRARLLDELDRRGTISYSYDLLNAAWVQIVSPDDAQPGG